MICRYLIFVLCFIPFFGMSQKTLQADNVRALVFRLSGTEVNAISGTVNGSSTSSQIPTSLAVWNAVEGRLATVSINTTLSGNGTPGSPVGLAQQGAVNGQVLKWNGTSWVPSSDDEGSGKWIGRAIDAWNSSTDGIGRLYWAGNSSTFYATGADHVFRNVSGDDIFRLHANRRVSINASYATNATLTVEQTALNHSLPFLKVNGVPLSNIGGDAEGYGLYLSYNIPGNRQFVFADTEGGQGVRFIGASIDGFNVINQSRQSMVLGTETHGVGVAGFDHNTRFTINNAGAVASHRGLLICSAQNQTADYITAQNTYTSTTHFRVLGDGSITSSSLAGTAGSGDKLVFADESGKLFRSVIGSVLQTVSTNAEFTGTGAAGSPITLFKPSGTKKNMVWDQPTNRWIAATQPPTIISVLPFDHTTSCVVGIRSQGFFRVPQEFDGKYLNRFSASLLAGQVGGFMGVQIKRYRTGSSVVNIGFSNIAASVNQFTTSWNSTANSADKLLQTGDLLQVEITSLSGVTTPGVGLNVVYYLFNNWDEI
jgi:hypothetical protein